MVTQKPPVKTTTRPAAAKPASKPAAKAVAARAVAAKKPAVAAKPAAPAKVAKAKIVKAAAPALKKPVTPVAGPALKPVAKSPVVKAEKKVEPKLKKIKQVRDSFTMPETEYEVLSQVKKTCLKAGFEIKKSDLLRIGVSLIKNLETSKLKTLLAGLTPLKVGRPKK